MDEAEYAMSEKSSLSLFDCLIPKLPGYLKRKRSDSDDSTTSYIHKDEHYQALDEKDQEIAQKDKRLE